MLRRGLNGGEEALQYPTRFPARTMVASIVFAAAVIGGFEPLYLRMIVADRDALRASAAAVADRDTPQYATFLEQVRARTPTGASIAILAPVRHWQDGYDYWYYRACYILHGRRVLPILDRSDVVHPDRLRSADYIADWGVTARFPGQRLVWRGPGGALLRRSP